MRKIGPNTVDDECDERRCAVWSDSAVPEPVTRAGGDDGRAASRAHPLEPASFVSGHEDLVVLGPGPDGSICDVTERVGRARRERVCLHLVVGEESDPSTVGREKRMNGPVGSGKWTHLEAVEPPLEETTLPS